MLRVTRVAALAAALLVAAGCSVSEGEQRREAEAEAEQRRALEAEVVAKRRAVILGHYEENYVAKAADAGLGDAVLEWQRTRDWALEMLNAAGADCGPVLDWFDAEHAERVTHYRTLWDEGIAELIANHQLWVADEEAWLEEFTTGLTDVHAANARIEFAMRMYEVEQQHQETLAEFTRNRDEAVAQAHRVYGALPLALGC